ncbi:hypothetical protein TREMEDRAFT_59516 [Tremella mesenterica DSM 1558]|uniref:uncharacterized protein n=1 Tax=Tremella mesenterica (strain ATCC 24925 / CBS 8224 / DSM 1558 / NBRC 9311 / NRRL Y-6157 / RJB 2259-6 / UBC 559-6) TaxID=578456 RepID=UPI0003F4A050|nr:uncharacterized protein TREMEDRAFT_59516 [Tremella mesenterica DSM 1558]EIW73350.1 hypothetical protein TREMEDRAFT_59516 [Tremella mesenterica DSM 1558]
MPNSQDSQGTGPPSLTIPGYIYGTSPSGPPSFPALVNLFSKNSGPATPDSDANTSSLGGKLLSLLPKSFRGKSTQLAEKSGIHSETSTPDGQAEETAEFVHSDATKLTSPAPSGVTEEQPIVTRISDENDPRPSTNLGDGTPGADNGKSNGTIDRTGDYTPGNDTATSPSQREEVDISDSSVDKQDEKHRVDKFVINKTDLDQALETTLASEGFTNKILLQNQDHQRQSRRLPPHLATTYTHKPTQSQIDMFDPNRHWTLPIFYPKRGPGRMMIYRHFISFLLDVVLSSC